MVTSYIAATNGDLATFLTNLETGGHHITQVLVTSSQESYTTVTSPSKHNVTNVAIISAVIIYQ